MRNLIHRLSCALALILSCTAVRAEEGPQWLTYPGSDGPGKAKRVVLIAADQEYRSEQFMPMMAKILSTHHGFDCTVLFAVYERREVDATMPVYSEKGQKLREHHVPVWSSSRLRTSSSFSSACSRCGCRSGN